jgi:hypothetical protein
MSGCPKHQRQQEIQERELLGIRIDVGPVHVGPDAGQTSRR